MKYKSILLALIAIVSIATVAFAQPQGTPSYNFSRALEEAQQGNKQSAMEYFNKEIADNPKNGYAYLAVAAFHLDNSDYGDARTATESALKYLPKKDKVSRAKVHLLRSQLLTIEQDTIGAYSDMATAIRLDPTNEEAYEKRGQLFYEQGRYDEGDADYRKILEINPGGEMGRMGLGRNAYARKDYDTAIGQYDRIIALYPDYSSGYSFRAEAYIAKGEYLKAMDDICKALEIDSDSKAHYLLFQFPPEQHTLVIAKLKGLSAKHPHTGEYEYYAAQVYNDNRMFVKSNEALERAFSIDARSFLLEMIADNYSEMGDYANALNTIDRTIQMNPDDDNLIAKRADILGESGDIDGAIEQWGEYIKKNPDFYGGYYRRGFFEDHSNRTEEALADYDMAIMLSPSYAYAYLGKGDMLETLGRHDEAIEAYQKVVELDTVPCNESCAMYALLALNRREEAVAFMDKVIANDSIIPGNYYDAACFTCRLGETEKALEYLRTAFDKGFRRFHPEGTVINLRQIDFGGLKLDNVRASVVRNQKAPLLLGQSVLGRLGKIEIDNQNKKLIIKTNR